MAKKQELLDLFQRGILEQALTLWQDAFVGEIQEMKENGEICMFHPNYSNILLREFALKLNLDLPTSPDDERWKKFD